MQDTRDPSAVIAICLAAIFCGLAVAPPAALAATNGRIVFSSDRIAQEWSGKFDLFTSEPDGSDLRRITTVSMYNGGVRPDPDSSPDGSRVVFHAYTGGFTHSAAANWDIFIAHADGSGVMQLTFTPDFEMDPAWSPDGTRIAFSSYTNASYIRDVHVINADGSGRHRVTRAAERVSQCGYPNAEWPDWLSDNELVFSMHASEPASDSTSNCDYDLFAIGADGSGLRRVTNTRAAERHPAPSPDGTSVAYEREYGIWVTNADGSSAPITGLVPGHPQERPDWSPDGNRIVFQTGRPVDGQGVGTQVWTMKADGTDAVPVTRGRTEGQNHDPSWARAADGTPPLVTCSAAGTGWHNANVTLSCTAADDESGLADPADASFTLSTSVDDGVETADAVTTSREVCDAAGNCQTAGPFTGIKIDRKAPAAVLQSPAAGGYLLNAPVAADYACSDGGSGIATCSAPVANGGTVFTSGVGMHIFTVEAVDGVGNRSAASVTYAVSYGLRLLYDPAKPTHRIRLQLVDAAGITVSDPSIVLTPLSIDGTVLLNDDFAYVKRDDSYLYSVHPRTRLPEGPHSLFFTAGSDLTVHKASFSAR